MFAEAEKQNAIYAHEWIGANVHQYNTQGFRTYHPHRHERVIKYREILFRICRCWIARTRFD